ncbi:hypothetical protein C483_06907 [Natrialba hulunbeirensis JCM 10989]|uniref:Halobacterial output domain-containing protein n=1 Tax=Natrialba hulunbeirensis JCM 10989 TaxID=1227493 RepID=M0A4M0_9EURY|nr:HalOD1 output domain-containing protein [Natrialba hulunbeirensis]ELY92857.1 hypothetical protein C483_06907 [Natrialba hulunbeirensis JCM 10989]
MVSHNPGNPPTDGEIVLPPDQYDAKSIPGAIVRAVAIEKNVPVTDLSPLYEQVDPDAIAELLDHANTKQSTVRIEFVFEGYRVIAADDGCLRLHEV